MLQNYLKIAFRNLMKYKGYTAINLVGLSIGLASGILIMTHVVDELSFDTFHERAERIVRIGTGFKDLKTGEDQGGYDANGWPLGKTLQADFAEIEKLTYLRYASGLDVNFEGKKVEEKGYFADKNFLQIFSFPLQTGNPVSALAEPYSIVISETMQAKYFGGESGFGKSLVLGDSLHFVIKGVMADVPANSHMQFDMLVSFSTYEALNANFSYDAGWGNINVRNYALLKEDIDFVDFKEKVSNTYMDHAGEMFTNWGMLPTVIPEQLPDLYLQSDIGNGMGPQGKIGQLYLLVGIGIFVILLACINFINLSTARSVYRAKEVGLRKVVGSTRKALIFQLLTESLCITMLSFFMAIIMVDLAIPLFNDLIGKTYTFDAIFSGEILVGMISLIIAITLLAGYYPAVFITGARPAEVLKGKMQSGRRGINLRRSLVVFQFFVSSALVISTLLVMDQLKYMQSADVGFEKDQVFILNSSGASSDERERLHNAIKHEISGMAGVQSVSYANAYPGRHGWSGQVAFPEGATRPEESVSVEYITVDEAYLDVLDLQLIAGNNFNVNNTASMKDGLVLNETAVYQFGWDNPESAIGRRIDSPSKHPAGEVIGVVKDYHHYGLQQKMVPIVLDVSPENSYYYLIKFNIERVNELVLTVENLWQEQFPGYAYDYRFLDDQYDRQYHKEQRLGKVFLVFATVTILIAVIGLVGLLSFIVISKSKEIGVRKVLGARTIHITANLSREFILLVVVGNVLAMPVIWYIGKDWLTNFAYSTELSYSLFALTLIGTIGIAILTMSMQTFKAGRLNPIDVLKDE